MNLEKLLHLSEDEKKNYWDFFLYEKTLMDIEEDLSRDYEYYSNKLKSLGSAHTTLDISIHTVYHSHLRNIKHLMHIMEDIKDYDRYNNQFEQQLSEFIEK